MKYGLLVVLLLAALSVLAGCSKEATKAEDAPAYAKQMQKGDSSTASTQYATQYGQSGAMRGPGAMQGRMQGSYGQRQGGYGQQGR
ncbi:hypothetical protein [Armatimonas rosea]|uniref:Lipoprotein n=1 Tax=Armatimonas rosea TaxID=685828 RepID=A0A7W9W5B6_ARMRO|nr:hypothetical protein [Armatimonas rosea]MBB6048886.1 hypothetical protein [Armatimonas rosea]